MTSSQTFEIRVTTLFLKEAKSLKKKYPSIKASFDDLRDDLRHDPINRAESSLGQECYKVRMEIEGKKAGKSYGARVIIHVKIIDKIVYLLSVYDKSDRPGLDTAISDLLKDLENPFD